MVIEVLQRGGICGSHPIHRLGQPCRLLYKTKAAMRMLSDSHATNTRSSLRNHTHSYRLSSPGRLGKTALMVAVQGGHSAAVAALLSCGVDAWRGEIRGNTALHMAVWQVRTFCSSPGVCSLS
jgi:ankyrin repeat protein